jgi:hypothetical protein
MYALKAAPLFSAPFTSPESAFAELDAAGADDELATEGPPLGAPVGADAAEALGAADALVAAVASDVAEAEGAALGAADALELVAVEAEAVEASAA